MKAPTQKQLVERWENVLRVLRALTPHQRKKHWDMETYGEVTDCGTVACAAGHCGMDPWFRRRGFKATPVDSHPNDFLHGGTKVLELSLYLPDFFGHAGAHGILWNATRRPVGTVIREVRDHIKWLKAAP